MLALLPYTHTLVQTYVQAHTNIFTESLPNKKIHDVIVFDAGLCHLNQWKLSLRPDAKTRVLPFLPPSPVCSSPWSASFPDQDWIHDNPMWVISASYNWSAIRFVPCQPTKLPPAITDKFLFCLSYKGEWVLYALCLRKVVYEDKGPTCVPQRKERINVGYACDDV